MNIYKYINHFSTGEKAVNIIKSKELRANKDDIICCTVRDDLMNYPDNIFAVKFIINLENIRKINGISIYPKSPIDKDYVESEEEVVIDMKDCNIKYLKIDNDQVSYEYSNKIYNDSKLNKYARDLFDI